MTLKVILLSIILAGCVYRAYPYRICVPREYMRACQEMLQVPTASDALLECVGARDRTECLYFVQQREADFVPVEPEDMYMASRLPNQDSIVFLEYRTLEEPEAEFRYEAVIVVHKDLSINNLDQLKGLKSCHTGVNRNAGYKIPLTMLQKRTVFPKQNEPGLSPKENELKALATFFKQSCLVGSWSPDEKTTSAWKAQYNQLCALCEHPQQCDYPDDFSGYEGALRCLAHNGGEVAFTKVYYVHKFFGLPLGTIPARESSENPDDFAYLCVDGSKRKIKEKVCSWAARPWPGLLANPDILSNPSPIREKIKQLAEAGVAKKPEWFTRVLGLSDKIYHVSVNSRMTPAVYLKKANYTEVIERGHGLPEPIVRMCVTSVVAKTKCRAMSEFSFSRDVRPRIDCVLEGHEQLCHKSVQDNLSDLSSADGLRIISAARKYNLHPVFHEVYDNKKPNYAVAVVKKDSQLNNIDDLRGQGSCHSGYTTFSGLQAPLFYLINKKTIKSATGQCVKNLGEFFGGSCVPDIDQNNPTDADVSNLKKQCGSDSSALKCLQENRGKVAFISSADLSNYDASQYELLCLNRESGGRDALSNYATCNIVMEPPRTWLSSKDFINDVSISHAPLSLVQVLSDRTDLFNIYGEFQSNNNVIFNKAAKGLMRAEKLDFDKLGNIFDVIEACDLNINLTYDS